MSQPQDRRDFLKLGGLGVAAGVLSGVVAGALQREMEKFARTLGGFRNVQVHFNTLDEPGRGLNGVYLSLLGTSAEDADSGQVGRGNRVNGLSRSTGPWGPRRRPARTR